jgi:predicted GNAT superfamily acetyltransferase
LIRNATADDFPAILALNAVSVRFLSPLDDARLRQLHAQAAYHRVVEAHGRVVAFLLALREEAQYDSPNYLWFAQRYSTFLYIDRIVVDAAERGRNLGAQLYDDILALAAASRVPRLTCEFDLDPPNSASANFHLRFGFREVGRQRIRGGTKEVSLQVREVEGGTTESGMIGT